MQRARRPYRNDELSSTAALPGRSCALAHTPCHLCDVNGRWPGRRSDRHPGSSRTYNAMPSLRSQHRHLRNAHSVAYAPAYQSNTGGGTSDLHIRHARTACMRVTQLSQGMHNKLGTR